MSQAQHTRTANRVCARCEEPFYAAPSRITKTPGGGTYCSRTCQSGKQIRTCLRCGGEFEITAFLLGRGYGTYCSAKCRRKRVGICAIEGCEQEIRWGDLCQWHYSRRTMVRIRYGLTLEQDESLRAMGCAICGEHPPDGARSLHIDHDHVTGEVRAALCHGCNTGLGSFGEDPVRLRAAADYLEKACLIPLSLRRT